MESSKHIVIKTDAAKILFNEVKGLFVSRNPSIKRLTDDIFVEHLLKHYKSGGKIGK